MSAQSSGLLLFRRASNGSIEILIGHMGGPFWAKKHEHAWSIPKGLHDELPDGTFELDALTVAEREFAEEMGSMPPAGETFNLGSVKASRKTINVFAREADFDATAAISNTFEMEWPRGSGRMRSFPEIDRAAWVSTDDATTLLTKGQLPFVSRLLGTLRQ